VNRQTHNRNHWRIMTNRHINCDLTVCPKDQAQEADRAARAKRLLEIMARIRAHEEHWDTEPIGALKRMHQTA